MNNCNNRKSGEIRDFVVITATIALICIIIIFAIIDFWWLTLGTIGILLVIASIISILPMFLKVKHYRNVVIIIIAAGIICLFTSLFLILPSFLVK